MPTLQVRLLGRLELIYSGKRLVLPATRKAQALLAYLILNRAKPHPRDHLMTLFWGERPEDRARGSLSTALWHIGHCLPEKSFLISDAHLIQFSPHAALWLDSAEFETLAACTDLPHLESAVELYRGEFLPGLYEDWIVLERYRLEHHYLEALARLMAAYESHSEYRLAMEISQRLLSQDALREDAHRMLMRACCWLGQRNAAIEQYHRCRQTILEELGTEPMLETQQLYRAILDGKFVSSQVASIEPLQSEITLSGRQAGHDPMEIDALLPFLGREREIEALEATWQHTIASHGRLMVVEGEAGVGKTRLVEEFARRLRWRGVQVLWGRSYEFERLLPYQPVAEALRSAMPILLQFISAGEKGWMLREISRLVPELGAYDPNARSPIPQSIDWEQAQLFEGVAHFIASISQPNGLLVVLEDVHWATESTLELLHYLIRHLSTQRILFLVTVRLEEIGQSHPMHAFQEQLNRDGTLRKLHLEQLSPKAVESIVLKMSSCGEAILPLAQRLYRETEGNPFFLKEVIEALFENHSIYLERGAWQGDFTRLSAGRFPLPASLSEAVGSRIKRLDAATQEAISLAAVIGREFDFALLKEAWGRSHEQTMQAIDTLLRRRLVEEGSGAMSRDYVFTHHKIQEVIYASLPRLRRCQSHALIGTLIEKAGEPRLYEHAGELAHHFFQASQLDEPYAQKAIDYLLKAGDQARVLYAHNEAIGHYHLALQLTQKGKDLERAARVNMKLGVTYHNAFQYEKAHLAFEEGFRLRQKYGDLNWPEQQHDLLPLRLNWPPITSIDPAFAMDLPGLVALQLFSGLVNLSADLEAVPDAAKKWEVRYGGREYVFHLRDNLHWTDGTRLTAEDFEFAGKRFLAPSTQSPFANLLYDIKGGKAYHLGQLHDPAGLGIRAVDETTLVIELERPACYFLQLLANFLPVPRHILRFAGAQWTAPENLVTNGAFRVDAWEAGDSMILGRNPGYHGKFNGNVSQVRLEFQSDPELLLGLYADDRLDILDIKSFPEAIFRNARQKYIEEYLSLPWAMIHFLGFNVACPPFQDVRIRRAFALAIDKETLAGGIQQDAVYPATGGFVPPGLPGHSPGIGLPFNPNQAKALFAQAGYPNGRGFPEINAVAPFGMDKRVTRFLAAQWREILSVGIQWETVFSGWVTQLDRAPAPIFISHWLADYPDPDDVLGASQVQRWTRWQDEGFLRLLERTRSSTNQARRLKLFEQADRLLIEAAAIIPISYDRQHLLIKPWVKRYPMSALYSLYWNDVLIEPH